MGSGRLFQDSLAIGLALAVAGCAEMQTGRRVREGVLPDGSHYQDFSRMPYGYRRVMTTPDGRKEIRELHTEQNFEHLKPGMTPTEVEDVVGVTPFRARYAFGTSSWTYRYSDAGIAKLLHVIFSPDGRMQRYEYEWDPNVYSKGGGKKR